MFKFVFNAFKPSKVCVAILLKSPDQNDLPVLKNVKYIYLYVD